MKTEKSLLGSERFRSRTGRKYPAWTRNDLFGFNAEYWMAFVQTWRIFERVVAGWLRCPHSLAFRPYIAQITTGKRVTWFNNYWCYNGISKRLAVSVTQPHVGWSIIVTRKPVDFANILLFSLVKFSVTKAVKILSLICLKCLKTNAQHRRNIKSRRANHARYQCKTGAEVKPFGSLNSSW